MELFPKYDNIIAVSKPCADVLKANFNVCKDKISVLHNIIDSKTIIEKSNAFIADFDKQFIHFLTVARISDEKGFSLAVQACKYLKNNNLRFKWFWVGDGPQRLQFEKMISDNALEDCFVLMGNQSNPYPYFKACDIYVQTSFTEAYCTTVMEAKVLCKPIVSTQVKSISEQVIDGKTALISKIDGIALGEKLYEIAADRELRESLTENLLKERNNEENIINEYYELFG